MNPEILTSLSWSDWLHQFQHYLILSLLSIGGAVTALPDINRVVVLEHGFLTQTQFNESVALAQAAPGPNGLFIVLIAWNIGMNTGSMATGFFSILLTMTGILVPSSVLTYLASGWLQRNRELLIVCAFKQGLVSIVIALLIATGWIMASVHSFAQWELWGVTIIAALLAWRTRIHVLWLISSGAVLGWFGFI